jgi:uncharacterized protein YwgA
MALVFSNDLCSAFLVEIVKAFEANHRRHYLGRTAMQKLAYFSQAVGVPIPCSFEIYNFGPYSDAVTFTVESMIADDILKDTSSSPKYSNYRINSHASAFDNKIISTVAPFRKRINNVVKVLGKFEPAQLELIATLHFIGRKIESLGDVPSKEKVLAQFFRVKGDKFHASEVSSWYDSLKDAKLI